jgi:hypothetical protein
MAPVTHLFFVFSYVLPFFYFSHFVSVLPPPLSNFVRLKVFDIIKAEAVNSPELLRSAHLTYLMFTLIAR